MEKRLKAWQRTAIRNNMENYRRAQDDYYIRGKPMALLENGLQAFSLVSPPLGSPAARRRVRLIMNSMMATAGAASDGEPHAWAGARVPHVVTLAVTYRCQCRCEHCSAASYRDGVSRDGTSLTLDELKDVARQSVDLGVTCVVLTGGEPLLLDGLHDLIDSIDRARSVCTLFTNGEFLDGPAALRLKTAGLLGAYVSLDYPDAARHDRNRGRPGLFDKAVAAIEACRAAGVPAGISTYATRENIRDGGMEAMMELARRLGVLEVFLFDVIPTGRLAGRFDCLLDAEDTERVRSFRAEYNARPDYPRIIHQTMFSTVGYPCAAEGCPAASVQCHVRANGDVSPCAFTPRSFGNVRRTPLKEIWDSMSSSSLYAEPSPRCRLSQRAFWDRLASAETPAP